jgi:outer membrane immunogenic protein
MKKILLSSVALLSLSAGAFAADLPSRRAAPAPFVAAAPAFTWTGFYVGGNAGYAWTNNNHDDNIVFAPGTFGAGTGAGTITFNGDRNADGFAGGGQVGFNYQFTPGTGFVVGVEADIQGIDLSRNNDSGRTFTFTGPVPVGFQPVRNDVTSLDWFGTVRGRLGYAFDRTLVYATGGFAYGDGNNNSDCRNRFPLSSFCGNGNSDTRWGYAVGGGVEFALPMMAGLFGSSAVTFGVEGLYVNLDDNKFNGRRDLVGFTADGSAVFNNGNGPVRGNDDNNDFGVVRAKINFKF